MKLKLKLHATFGEITPNSFVASKNEILDITIDGEIRGKAVLKSSAFQFTAIDNQFTIQCGLFDGHTNLTIVDIVDGIIRKTWTVKPIIVTSIDDVVEVANECEFYKNKYLVAEFRLKELEKFKDKATRDIANLTVATNALIEEFAKVKEEMAL